MSIFYRFKNFAFFVFFGILPIFPSHAERNPGSDTTPDQEDVRRGSKDFSTIKEAFLQGRFPSYYFDDSKAATRGLIDECDTQRRNLTRKINKINSDSSQYSSPHAEEAKQRNAQKNLVNVFKGEIRDCGSALFTNYYDEIYKKGLRDRAFREMTSAFIQHSVQPQINEEWWNIKKQSQQFGISGSGDFFEQCIKHVASLDRSGRSSAVPSVIDSPRNWSQVFTALYRNSCFQRRSELERFVKDNIRELDNIQRGCSDKSLTCLTELKQKVARADIDTETGTTKWFFQNCHEGLADTHHCCSDSPTGCSRYKEIQNKYQNVIAQNQEQGQCSADSSHFQDIKREIRADIQQICRESAKTCRSQCDTELQNFKTQFLTCFRLPSWTKAADYLQTMTGFDHLLYG